MINVDAVGFEYFFDLINEALPSCLDAQYLVYFVEVVGGGFGAVDVLIAKAIKEIGAYCIENKFILPEFEC